jgi:hypothetical protein
MTGNGENDNGKGDRATRYDQYLVHPRKREVFDQSTLLRKTIREGDDAVRRAKYEVAFEHYAAAEKELVSLVGMVADRQAALNARRDDEVATRAAEIAKLRAEIERLEGLDPDRDEEDDNVDD